MLVEDVGKMEPVDRFLYWIKERYQIHLKRRAGMKKPWTDDWVLQNNFFTMPYREMDKTTVWFCENVRDPLYDDPAVLMATVIFRWFNYIPTGFLLRYGRPEEHGTGGSWEKRIDLCYLCKWKEEDVVKVLQQYTEQYGKVFTGAYMIRGAAGPPGCKIPSICQSISSVWKDREDLVSLCHEDCRLRALWEKLTTYKYLGAFMAYELVCDLRYTYLLENATDVDTWANPGPGAHRGLMRLRGHAKETPGRWYPKAPDALEGMRQLLKTTRRRLGRRMPKFELREIEHSLCEWDKYERARLCDGQMKRKYNGAQ